MATIRYEKGRILLCGEAQSFELHELGGLHAFVQPFRLHEAGDTINKVWVLNWRPEIGWTKRTSFPKNGESVTVGALDNDYGWIILTL